MEVTHLGLLKSVDSKKISKSDLIALEHYERKPDGRSFYAVADILLRMERPEEAIQILSLGLQKHPNYSVARVLLAQTFFQQKFVKEAWETLESSPTPLRSNLTARILRLKICLIIGYEAQVRSLSQELLGCEFQDTDAKYVLRHIDIKSFADLRRDYIEYLQWPLSLLSGGLWEGGEKKKGQAPEYRQEAPFVNAEFRQRVAKGFFSSPLTEIFVKSKAQSFQDGSLDDLSKARLLKRQCLYQKSFEIYERLIYSSPSNELIRREFHEVRELRAAQKAVDHQLDPCLAEAMDRVRRIDDQIHVLEFLLRRVDTYDSSFA